ncbi:MAG: hypothetical protein WC637_00990 [Victivallales bacterium]|jgi:Sec-independent protein translocase protein TatA
MGMLNRFVNISVLVLAIVSVIFGSLLFLKREELRARGDKMAAFIVDIVKVLDVNSACDGSNNISAAKSEVDPKKDPNKAADNQKKSLYHNNYKNLETVLAPVKLQTTNIMEQRDALGTALYGVGKKLELSNAEDFPPLAFQGLPTYKEKRDLLLGLVTKVNERDNAIIKQISASATVMGFTIEADALKNLETYKTPLDEFASKVEKLKKRCDTYGKHIIDTCKIFEIKPPDLGPEDYGSALSSVASAMQEIKKQFEAVKKELEETKKKLVKVEKQLDDAKANIDSLNKNLDKSTKEIDVWKKKYRIAIGEEPDEEKVEVERPPAPDELVKKLEGKILEVNGKWDFVVIDLGKNSKITMLEGKRKKDIPVPLPEGKVMMVYRGSDYIAKIRITRVNDDTAVADILPDVRNGNVQVGDKVFFAPEPKVDAASTPALPGKAAKPAVDAAAPAAAK